MKKRAGVVRPCEAKERQRLSLERDYIQKELLEFQADTFRKVKDRLYSGDSRRLDRKRKQSVISLALAGRHVSLLDSQRADQSARNENTWEARAFPQDHHVERIAVRRLRRRYESPVVRVSDTDGQRAREHHAAAGGVVLQLDAGTAWCLDDDVDGPIRPKSGNLHLSREYIRNM